MIKPTKLSLTERSRYTARVVAENVTLRESFIGSIEVVCADAQAFAEVLNGLLHLDLAVAALQQAISALQMAKTPAERLPDMRRLQDYHFWLTGWYFDSASMPVAVDTKPSSGSFTGGAATSQVGTQPALTEAATGGASLPPRKE